METSNTTVVEASPVVYTVWVRPIYFENNEVWSGEDFGKALQTALDQVGPDPVVPLNHTAVAAIQSAGHPVSAWRVTDPDGFYRTVFITAD